MSQALEALKAHVPEAEEIIQQGGTFPSQEESALPFDLQGGEIVCKEGVSVRFYQQIRPWLDANQERRLFWIEEQPARLARLVQEDAGLPLLRDPRTRIFFAETSSQREFAIKKIGWMSALKELIVFGDLYKQEIERINQAACLIASDTADFGSGVMRHLQENLRSSVRSCAALRGSMQAVPALIVGAGPSLEESSRYFSALQDRALIIAAGSAVNKVPLRPHLAVAIDQHTPVKRTRYVDVPLCLQARLHPKTRSSAKGDLLYLSDSHYAFTSWLTDMHPFDGGWVAGNTAVAVAVEMGCDPIVLVGMDLCYRGKQKYAGEKRGKELPSLVRAMDASGHAVWTQRDWLLAISWMERMAAAHPERSFYNATAEGMQIGAPFSRISLADFAGHASSVSEQWSSVIQTAPVVCFNQDRLQAWKQSLLRCRSEESESMRQREFEGEIAAELLLEPLWRIWAPMFERELMVDPHPIAMEEKLAIQKRLFFNQIIQEHLHVLRTR